MTSQTLTTSDLTMRAWNTVILSTPVTIDATAELWIGYQCNVNTGYPAGCDAGPKVSYKGNMMYFNSTWNELTYFTSSLTYNWCIKGFLRAGDGSKATLKAIEENLPVATGTIKAQPNLYSVASGTRDEDT